MLSRFARENQRLKIGGNVVIIQQKFGEGAFGDVYKAYEEATNNEYALKEVNFRGQSLMDRCNEGNSNFTTNPSQECDHTHRRNKGA